MVAERLCGLVAITTYNEELIRYTNAEPHLRTEIAISSNLRTNSREHRPSLRKMVLEAAARSQSLVRHGAAGEIVNPASHRPQEPRLSEEPSQGEGILLPAWQAGDCCERACLL